MKRLLCLWLSLVLVAPAAGCIPSPAAATPAPVAPPPVTTVAATPAPEPSPSATPATGLIVRGHARLDDGSGLEGVAIYRRFASYPGEVIATTGRDGYYEAGPVYIPGDEMVSVWAALEGYVFEPAYHDWRHYHGLETRTLDFVASPASTAGEPGEYCPCQR